MDFTITREEEALRSSVAAICDSFGAAWYQERAEGRELTSELWSALAKAGHTSINAPADHGGGGAGITELALVVEEAASRGTPLLMMLIVSAITTEILAACGSEEQKRRWLPAMARGENKVVFAITEEDAGTNTLRTALTATQDGNDWILQGRKNYVSGFDDAEAVIVLAKTGSTDSGRALLSLFVVDTDAPGMEPTVVPIAVPIPERQYALELHDVRVSGDRLIGKQGHGLRHAFHGLIPERISGAAMAVGIGRYVIRVGADYARNRQVWGVPIATHQGVAHPLARAQIQLDLAWLMTRRAAWLHDRGLPATDAANIAKYAAAEGATAALDATLQLHGGNGLATSYGLLPYWGLARLLRVAPLNQEMVLNHVAQHSLGLPRPF